MPTLRLTQTAAGQDTYHVLVELKGDGLPRQTVTTSFSFPLTPQEHENLRWYLEDYLQNPHDPAPTIAARIEGQMAATGTKLFKAVFHADDDARDLWATLRTRLNDTRVEIVAGVQEATAPYKHLSHNTVKNILCRLWKNHGDGIVPTAAQLRKMGLR